MRSGAFLPQLILVTFFTVNTSLVTNAQTDDFLIKEIRLGTSKKYVEDFVAERLKAYYIHNTDNCWKTIKKKRGINLKKEAKREAFLKELESDFRTLFQQVDELEKVNLYNKYSIFITEIIGRYAKVHGFAPYTRSSGAGNYNVGFLKDHVRFISFNIQTTTSFSRFSGYEYDKNYVLKIKEDLNRIHPGIQHSSYKSTTHVCSDKGEPQYNEVFTFKKAGDYTLSFTHFFGPYIKEYNNYNCSYLGNHLTSLSVLLWNDKLK